MGIVDLLISFVIVFIASILFINSIEYLSSRLKFTKSFTGTVITPVFSSFPELLVFIISIVFVGGKSGHDVAIGTVLGEPFIVSTVSYSFIFIVIIISMLLKGEFRFTFDVEKNLYLPYLFISILFTSLLIPAYLSLYHLEMGIIFIIFYFVYFYLIKRMGGEGFEDEFDKPYLSSFMNINLAAALQLIISFVMLYFGSRMLVSSIIGISYSLGISSLTLSIVIVPVATALPETMISMIWAYKGKYSLAIYSVIGEIILCSSIYPGIALITIPWALNENAIISIISTSIVSFVYLISSIRRKMHVLTFLLGLFMFFVYLYIIF
ncbi:MAG: sodium:calcium antiporter [Thermoplasmata archaeon]|jgi:cation:H+ antiporter